MQHQHSVALESGRWFASPPPGEEVVISGIAGQFPNSQNIKEFRDNLFNKVYMVTSTASRWTLKHAEIPEIGGLIPDISRFDPGFFGIHHRQAQNMAEPTRLFMERAIESVVDAGVHPSELEGTKTGVFVAFSWSELECVTLRETNQPQSFAVTGHFRTQIANRISYYLKLKGPSICIDTACSSSLNAIEHAWRAIRQGEIDRALVGGCNLTLHPGTTLQFTRLGVLSNDGCCKVFDEDADGYVRADTISCIFLQKSSDAKRIYAQIVYAKINSDGFKDNGLTYPSAKMQGELLKEIYEESGLRPSQLAYFEVHGTGTRIGDVQEIAAVDEAIAKKRDKQLLIGSVKSNIGHAEPASGMSSLVKIILAFEEGWIAPNLHLKKIKSGLEGVIQGRMKVVTELTKLEGEDVYVGISNFGFGGNNCHVVIQRVSRKKEIEESDDLIKLVCVSGRTEEAVKTILEDLNQKKFSSDYIALLHQVFKTPFRNHSFRGYTIVSKTGPLTFSIKKIPDVKKHFYINFGKFDKSYQSVAQFFLRFPAFQASMFQINNILADKNINIINVIQKTTNSINNDLLGSAAVLIGIADTIKRLDIDITSTWSDGLGKLISAYFDNAMTIKEVIQSVFKGSTDMILATIKPKSVRAERYFNLDGNLNGTDIIKSNVVLPNSTILDISNHSTSLESESKFLQTLGSLYEQGCDLQLDKLYPEVQFPVGRNTPMISPLIKWSHEKIWYDTVFTALKKSTQVENHAINLADEENKYIEGHMIDGRVLFPATGYLYLVWEAFAKDNYNLQPKHVPVVFENCKFIRATTLSKTGYVTLEISIQRSGHFQILENNTIIVTGHIHKPDNIQSYQSDSLCPKELSDNPAEFLNQDEIYKELHLRGYNYSGLFKGLVKCDIEAKNGLVKWDDNWVSFMDTMLQMKILQMDSRLLYVPIGIKRLSIDPIKHLELIDESAENPTCPIVADAKSNILKCGGIEVHGLQASAISKRKPKLEPVLEKHKFVPNEASLDIDTAIRVNMQIILDNSLENNVKSLEIVDEATKSDSLLTPLIFNVLEDVPSVHPELTVSSKNPVEIIPGVEIEPSYTLGSTCNFLLIVATNLMNRPSLLKQVLTSLSPCGFVLTREEKNFNPDNVPGVTIVTQYIVNDEKIILLKKQVDEKRCYVEISSENFKWMSEVQKQIRTEASVVLYCQNPSEGILGFVNCLRREPGGRKVKCLFMMDKAPKFDPDNEFYRKQIVKNEAINVFKNGKWGTYRHLRLEESIEKPRDHSFVSVTSRGDLSSLRWVEGPLSADDGNENLVHTYYCAINFKDIMTASGRISATTDRINQESIEGFEYSGKDFKGRRIMGIIGNGALSTLISSDLNLLWLVPDKWSLEEAATVPVVYSTVIYALLMRTTLRPGTSILIHSATGGIGIAALNVALYHKCNIFVTVGTQKKREFLKKYYPQIPESHIGNSRDTSFEKMIKKETNGRGVDIVLNSLAEEKLIASVRCLARGGHFMEIGKFDLVNDNSFNLQLLEKAGTYHGVFLDTLFKETAEVKLELVKTVNEGLKSGYIKPLPTTVFNHDEAEKAFRYMTSGNHIGKVLVKIRDEENKKTMVPEKRLLNALPKFYCDHDKSYVVIGGLGGFGLELTDWLVLRGARKLLLTSRFGVQNGYQTQRIKIWESYGAKVQISTTTITSKQNCQYLIQEATKLGPVDAIFNLAVVLEDALFEDQTEEKFNTSLKPKAHATKYLDEVTRDLCPNLRYFVVFSSVSCGRGNAGQTNYGMANSIMERICEKRHQEGLPALAIQWGAIGDVGLVAKMQKDNRELVIGGTLQQKISNCLSCMDQFLRQNHPIVSSMVVAEKQTRGSGSAVDAVANILGIKDIKAVSQQNTLNELGMDSMMGTEIVQMLEKEFEIYITPKDLRTLTFSKLIELEAETKKNTDNNNQTRLEEGTKTILQLIPDSTTDNTLVVRLQSLVQPTETAPTVLVLPGIEGVLKLLDSLTQNLKAHVLGVQYSYHNPEVTIEDTATVLLTMLSPYLTKDKPIVVIGYSFGAVVALELISLLEQQGFTCRLIALDGSPAYSSAAIKTYAPGETQAEFETNFILHILSTFLPDELIKAQESKLLQSSTTKEKISLAKSIIPTELQNKFEEQAGITLLQRANALLNYKFAHQKIKSLVFLYKAKFPIVTEIHEDYQLSEICEEKIRINVLEGDHLTIVQRKELVDEINAMLNEL